MYGKAQLKNIHFLVQGFFLKVRIFFSVVMYFKECLVSVIYLTMI